MNKREILKLETAKRLSAQAKDMHNKGEELKKTNKVEGETMLAEAADLAAQALAILPNPGIPEEDFNKMISYMTQSRLTPWEITEKDLIMEEVERLLKIGDAI
jgi:hypothetical protein